MHSPTVSDFDLLKRILRYVKGTSNMGLPIKKNDKLNFSAFCNGDYVGCKEKRRSTTRFVSITRNKSNLLVGEAVIHGVTFFNRS